jgi:hypothetical protein
MLHLRSRARRIRLLPGRGEQLKIRHPTLLPTLGRAVGAGQVQGPQAQEPVHPARARPAQAEGGSRSTPRRTRRARKHHAPRRPVQKRRPNCRRRNRKGSILPLAELRPCVLRSRHPSLPSGSNRALSRRPAVPSTRDMFPTLSPPPARHRRRIRPIRPLRGQSPPPLPLRARSLPSHSLRQPVMQRVAAGLRMTSARSAIQVIPTPHDRRSEPRVHILAPSPRPLSRHAVQALPSPQTQTPAERLIPPIRPVRHGSTPRRVPSKGSRSRSLLLHT